MRTRIALCTVLLGVYFGGTSNRHGSTFSASAIFSMLPSATFHVETHFNFNWYRDMNSGSGHDIFVTYYSIEKGVPVRLESRESNGKYFTRDLVEHTPAK